MASFTGIGCMSGSSLDGLDLCHVEFTGDVESDIWGYRILKAETIPYSQQLENRLRTASKLTGEDILKLHISYGHYLGEKVTDFMLRHEISAVDFVASHGHTIFHQPENRFTFQLGEGETTASYLNCPFVCNFRSKDLALGGQGAPLVPVGEKLLYTQYDICINLGGITNIGLRGSKGYDVCPCNFVMNRLAEKYDSQKKFDKDGEIASQGQILTDVLQKLEAIPYYKHDPPKSLGVEWMEENVFPLLDTSRYSIPDLMSTFVEHIATRMAHAATTSSPFILGSCGPANMLISGGGAFNKFLVGVLKNKLTDTEINIDEADEDTICFKEALIVAFLGLRCLLGIENVLSDVTGSSTDSVSGSIHRPMISTALSPTKVERFNFHLRRQRSSVSSN